MRECDLVLFGCVALLAACASDESGDSGDLPQDGTEGTGSGTDGTTPSGSDDGGGTETSSGDGTGGTGTTGDGGSTNTATGTNTATSASTATGTSADTGASTDTGTDTDTGTSVAECGNGAIEAGEQCDDPDLGGQTCVTMGLTGGTLACTESCIFDTSACDGNTCGDGTIDGLDECDCGAGSCSAAQLDNKACADFPPFDDGTLDCHSPYNCTFDISGCYDCGDGNVDPTEVCDGTDLDGKTCETLGYLGGDLACDAGCNLDTSDCTLPTEITKCSTPNVSIPDPGNVIDTVTVTLAGTVTDVNVLVQVNHNLLRDVDIQVQHLATNRWLVRDRCSSSDDIDAIFDDEGSTLVCGSTPAINGNVIPEESLDAYDSMEAQGDWSLQAFDDTDIWSGILEHWCVTISF